MMSCVRRGWGTPYAF